MKHENGFTLVELMIVLAISGIVMAAIVGVFVSQQKAYEAQEQIAVMQQNVRAAQDIMTFELRMTGYDPLWADANNDGRDDNRLIDGVDNDCDGPMDAADGNEDIGFGIITAGPSLINFVLDLNGDGDICDPNENITFGFSPANDANGDGIADDLDGDGLPDYLPLGRNTGGGFQPMADGIYAVGFAYAFDDAADGDNDPESIGGNIIWAVDTNPVPDGILDTDINGNALGGLGNDDDGDPVAPIGIASIRAVKIWLLAVALRPDPAFAHAAGRAYRVGNKVIVPAPNDRRRMRLITTTVLCRNM